MKTNANSVTRAFQPVRRGSITGWKAGVTLLLALVCGALAEVGVGISPNVSVDTRGTHTATTLRVTPDGTTNFSTVAIGGSVDRVFTVANLGTTSITGTAAVEVPFSIVGTAGYTLAAGQQQTVTVRYMPGAAGTHTGYVTFTGGEGAARQVVGTGVAVATGTGSITGTVTDATTHLPLNGVAITVIGPGADLFTGGQSPHALTAGSGTQAGRYTITGLAPFANYQLIAQAKGQEYYVGGDSGIAVNAGLPPTEKNIALTRVTAAPPDGTPELTPVVLVRGRGEHKTWLEGESGHWTGLSFHLRQTEGFQEVWVCNEPEPDVPETSDDTINGELGIGRNAEKLKTYLVAKLANYALRRGALPGKIQFVAHSMGGLILRQALNGNDRIAVRHPVSGQMTSVKVQRTIMLGTPNAGSGLSVIAQGTLGINYKGSQWDSTKDLVPDAIQRTFNSKYAWPSGIPLYLLAGTGGSLSLDEDLAKGDLLLRAYNSVSAEKVTDGAVPRPSVSGKHHLVDMLGVREIKTLTASPARDLTDQQLGTRDDHYDLQNDTTVFSWVTSVLRGNVAAAPPEPAAAPAEAAPEPPPMRLIESATGVVSAAAPTVIDIPCDAASALRFDALINRAGVALTLRTPGGAVIDPASATAGSGIVFTQEVLPSSGVTTASYEVAAAEVGTWQAVLTVTPPDGGGDGAGYLLSAAVASTVAMQPQVAQTIAAGEEVGVLARLADTGTDPFAPLTNAQVTARLTGEDGSSVDIALFDNGLHGDGLAADGVYGAIFTRPAAAGTYRVSVRANGTRGDGAAVQRVAEVTTTLSPGGAGIVSGSVQREFLDTDGDGAVDRLRLECVIVPTEPGSYVLSGEMASADEAVRLHAAATLKDLPAGATTVNLFFDLQPALAAGYAGELVLSKLLLLAESSSVAGWLDEYREPVRVPYQPKPRIITQPQDRTVVDGGSGVLSVTAEGTGTLRYQWKRGGENIDGAVEATLTLTPVGLEQTGDYSVVVSDDMGFEESEAATVAALPRLPTVSGALDFGPVVLNTTVSGTLTITNSGTLPVTLTGIVYPAGFSGDESGGVLAAGASRAVNVAFTPTVLGAYAGEVAVQANAETGARTVAVSGMGSTLAFPPFKGAYRGAIRPPAMSHDHSGYLAVNLGVRGTFTAVVKLGGKTHRVRGAFDATGAFFTTLPGTTLTLALQLDVNRGTNEITGTIKQGDTLIANLSTDRAPGGFNARNPVPFAGRYTLLLPPDAAHPEAAYPQGSGFARLTVAATGKTRLSGVLGDATAFGGGGVLSEDGELAVYALLYGKRGSLSGWLTVRDASAANHIEGTLDWSKPETGVGRYPLGFAGQTVVAGSRYTRSLSLFAPAASEATLSFAAGDVTTNPATKDLLINAQGKVSLVGSERFKMTLAPASGFFSGMFTDTGGKPRSFRGAVLQEQGFGAGFFRGVEQTGSVEFQPTP